jgi:hypothetical protein
VRISDEILGELRNGASMSQIRAKYHSQSQIYEALRVFLEEISTKTEEKRRILFDTEVRLNEKRSETETCKAEKNRHEHELAEIAAQKEVLQPEVQSLKQQRDKLSADVEKLKQKGIRAETVSKLNEIVDKDGPQIWELLMMHEKAQQLKKDVDQLLERKVGLEEDVASMEAKEKKIAGKFRLELNKIDEVKRKAVVFKETSDATSLFIEDGLTARDLRSLHYGLNTVGIIGKVDISVERLVDGLAKEKSLIDLQEKVDSTQERLKTLVKAEADARWNFYICKQLTIKVFEDLKVAGLKYIQDYGTKTTEWMHQVLAGFEKDLENARQSTVNIARLEQELRQIQKNIEFANKLLEVFESNESLQRVEPDLAIRLLERLQKWLELKYANARVNVVLDILSSEYQLALPSLYGVKLFSFIKVTIEAVRELLLEEKLGSNSRRIGSAEKKNP